MPSMPARMQLPSMTGMVGHWSREPARTRTTGRMMRMFQLYISLSWVIRVVTVSELVLAVTSAFMPTTA